MRVMIFCHSGAHEVLGGGEKSILALAEAWRAQHDDVEFLFVTPRPAGLMDEAIRTAGHRAELLPYFPWVTDSPQTDPELQLAEWRDNAATVTAVRALIADFGPQLVITNTIVAPWGAIAAGLEGVAHAWFVREFGELHGLGFPYGKSQTLSDIALLSDLVVANSVAVRDHFVQSVPGAEVAISYPHITAPSAPPLPSGTPGADRPLSLLASGKISKDKGQHRIVEALALLSEAERARVHVSVVGAAAPSEYRQVLQDRIDSLGIGGSITLLDPVPDVSELLAAADAGLTLSELEPFGRVTLEYMLAGRPVIATASGGTTEIVSEGTGTLVGLESPDELADALRRYLQEPALIAKEGDAAKARAALLVDGEYSVANTIEQLRQTAGLSPVPSKTPNLVAVLLELLTTAHRFELTTSATLRDSRQFRLGDAMLAPVRLARKALGRTRPQA